MKTAFAAALYFTARLFAAGGGTTVIDSGGNVWQTGSSRSLMTTATAFQKAGASTVCGTENLSPFLPPDAVYCEHAYLSKRDSSGNLLYATYLGGSSQDGGTAVATDTQGNVYVAGYTYSADFPVTAGAVQPKNAGPTVPRLFTALGAPYGPASAVPGGDVFVAKFSAQGTLLFSTLLGGSNSELPTLVSVDSAGSVYVSGPTLSADFPLTADAMTHAQAGWFFARLNATGTMLVYSTYSVPSILDFDIDNQGIAYLTGGQSTGTTQSPGSAPYVTAVDTSGGAIVSSTYIPDAAPQISGAGVAIAASAQDLFLAVSPAPLPYNFAFPTPPTRTLGPSYFLQLPLSGGRILAETKMAQTQFDSILLDGGGNAYAFGHGSGSIPATPIQLLSEPCSGTSASFVLESDTSGSVVTATYFRQGDDSAVLITAPGHIALYRNLSSNVVMLDLTTQPAALFGCPANLASGVIGAGLAPGEVFLISGSGLGPAQGITAAPDAAGFYPTSLGGVQVLVDSKPVPLLYVQAAEIHAVAPFTLPVTSEFQVQYGGQPVGPSENLPPLDVGSTDYNPAIFAINGQGAIVNQDGTVNTPANPAPLGSIVSIYCTGTGYLETPPADGQVTPIPPPYNVTEPPAPVVTFAGIAGVTLWSGAAPGIIAGVTQINVQLPAALPAGTNLAAVRVILRTVVTLSPPVNVSVRQ
jgi:uncharacterized protein (TIGR03437 family)